MTAGAGDDAGDVVEEGLADERTDLAWNRSGLAFAVCAAVILRRTWPLRGADRFVALGAVSAGAAAWALALTIGRARRGTAPRPRRRLDRRRATTLTVGTLALALAGVILAFLPNG